MKVAQWCPTLCNPMDYIVHGILQARILEWAAFPFSRGSSQPRDQTQVSCIAGRFFTSWATREAQFNYGVFLLLGYGALLKSSFFVVVLSLSRVRIFVTPWTAAHPAPCPSLSPVVCSNSRPLSRRCYLTTSFSSVAPFSSCVQPFPASGCFPRSWLFTSDGQSIGASASVSVLLMHIQGWFPLRWTGLISLQSKGLSRVFSSTTNTSHL